MTKRQKAAYRRKMKFLRSVMRYHNGLPLGIPNATFPDGTGFFFCLIMPDRYAPVHFKHWSGCFKHAAA